MKILPKLVALTLFLTLAAQAQTDSQHMKHTGQIPSANQRPTINQQADAVPTVPHKGGQSAFEAIQEISNILSQDPKTDWSKVNVDRLRLHLIDMDNVTLRAKVNVVELPDGAEYHASSPEPDITASIQRMVLAHVTTMNGVEGWKLTAGKTNIGAILTVKGSNAAVGKIRALGFIGIMTVGAHHQSHHLALAMGKSPHSHDE